jgi:hypothetical protein
MRRAPVAIAAAAVAAVMTAGCTVAIGAAESPLCLSVGRPGSPATLLMAQSVPSATLIPCVSLVPAGWSMRSFHAGDGRADFKLGSDIAGSRAVDVVLVRRCDVRGATQVPTDQAGAVRWERITSLRAGFRGTRYYTFPGGCVRYEFTLTGPERAAPVNDVSLAVDFVSRAQLAAEVTRWSHGRLHLDP